MRISIHRSLASELSDLKVGEKCRIAGGGYASIRTTVWRLGVKFPKRKYRTELDGKTVVVFRDK